MLSERDIELAHPDAFDFVWGNLPAAKRGEFNRHLSGCRHCQAIVDEYREIGQIIKLLPPHVEPPAGLEDRTVAAMVVALDEQRATTGRRPDAEDRAATRVYPIPQRQPPAEPETEIQPIPPLQPRAEDDTVLRPSPTGRHAPIEPQARPAITPLPIWRRYPRRLAAAVAVAAAIIAAAIVIPLSLGRSALAEVVTFHLTPPPGSAQTASGTAVARPDASGSWTITLTVRHLRTFGDSPWYECWYVGAGKAGHPQVASAGTFLVPDSGSGTFTMTSAADPRQFKTMQIRLEQPTATGAIQGPVVLSATGKTA
jgi:anti-sigma factor RsiW